jgi:hypothetical protein
MVRAPITDIHARQGDRWPMARLNGDIDAGHQQEVNDPRSSSSGWFINHCERTIKQ